MVVRACYAKSGPSLENCTWGLTKDGVQFAVGSGKCLTVSGRMNFWEKRKDIIERYEQLAKQITESRNIKDTSADLYK